MIISPSVLRMRTVSDKSLEKSKEKNSSIAFSRKSCRLRDNEEKYGTAGQAKDDNIAYAHCILDN